MARSFHTSFKIVTLFLYQRVSAFICLSVLGSWFDNLTFMLTVSHPLASLFVYFFIGFWITLYYSPATVQKKFRRILLQIYYSIFRAYFLLVLYNIFVPGMCSYHNYLLGNMHPLTQTRRTRNVWKTRADKQCIMHAIWKRCFQCKRESETL